MVMKSLSPKSIELTNRDVSIKLPTILKGKVLMAPGEWNGVNYSKEDIKTAFENTDWEDKQNASLILDHADYGDSRRVELSLRDWIGYVRNPRFDELTGYAYGDLEIHDRDVIQKLVIAKAKFGVSPQVEGVEDSMGNFFPSKFVNFSVVTDPACKQAFINLSQEKKEEKDSLLSRETLKGGKKEMETEEKEDKAEEKEEEVKTEELASKKDLQELTSTVKELTEALKKKFLSEEKKELAKEEEEKKEEEVKEEEPAEEEEVAKEEEPVEEAVEEAPAENSEVKELTRKIEELQKRLDEPEERTVKELASKETKISFGPEHSDGVKAMGSFLQEKI